LRLPSVIAGVASVGVLYLVARDLLGVRAGLLAALGVAVAPYFVSYSDLARGCVLATLFLLVALWAAVRLAQGGRRRWWVVYGAGALGAPYTEYDTVPALVAVLLALGAPRRNSRP
jgi:uncharacterized membrane protein